MLVAGNLDLDLPAFALGNDLLQRMRQLQQRSASLEQLVEELSQCLFHTLDVKTQELACVGDSDFDEVELRGQSSRNTGQYANSTTGESKLRWDLYVLLIKYVLDILNHFEQIQFTHLSQRHPVIPLYHQRYGPLDGVKVCPFVNKAKLRECMNEGAGVARYVSQEHIFHELFHMFRERPHHPEVDEGDDGSITC